jgi:hypothetical protein
LATPFDGAIVIGQPENAFRIGVLESAVLVDDRDWSASHQASRGGLA